VIPNVVKGSSFRGLLNYLLVGRKNAAIIGGNMVGRDALELTREFGISRRLRPKPKMPVMHHTLSFADNEDPGDAIIAQAAERYIQRMGLEGHQWVAIVHRDKAHIHVHLAICRIGFGGTGPDKEGKQDPDKEEPLTVWWNATHDFERSQVVAAQIEVEFGFVQVPRTRLQAAIRSAVHKNEIRPPKVPPPQPKPETETKQVLGEIRKRLEAVPHGLPAPEWKAAVEAQGLHLKPSFGGEKISGFTVTLPGHRAVKLSDVHRSLSWVKLTTSGRVRYDPFFHFEVITRTPLEDHRNDLSTEPAEPHRSASRSEARSLDPDTNEWLWEWEPTEPRVVVSEMEAGDALECTSSTVPPPPGTADFGGEIRGHDAAPPKRSGAPYAEVSGVATSGIQGDGVAAQEVVGTENDIGLSSTPSDRQAEHVLDHHSIHGKGIPHPGSPRVHAAGPDTWPEGPNSSQGPLGGLAQPLGRSVSTGRLQNASKHGGQIDRWSLSGWSGLRRDARELVGPQVDFQDLGLLPSEIPAEVRTAATTVVRSEAGHSLPSRELGKRVVGREMLWEEAETAQLSPSNYRRVKAAVQHHLEPAREVIRDLTRMAKSGAMPGNALPSKQHWEDSPSSRNSRAQGGLIRQRADAQSPRKPKRARARALAPLKISPEAQAELEAYVRAFFAGELRRVTAQRQPETSPSPIKKQPVATPTSSPVSTTSEWASDIELVPDRAGDSELRPQDITEMDPQDRAATHRPKEQEIAPRKGNEHMTRKPGKQS